MGSAEFTNALGNTLMLNMMYILLCGILALFLTLAISSIRSNKLQQMFQFIILIPYFIPMIVLAYITMMLVSVDQSPIFKLDTILLGDPTWWTMIVISLKTVSTVGIPVIIALAAVHASSAERLSSKFVPALRAILAFMLIQCSTVLSFDLELIFSMANALVLDVAETISLLEFRSYVDFGSISQGTTIYATKFVIQLILTILVYLLVRRWFKSDLFHRETSGGFKLSNIRNSRFPYAGTIVAILYSCITLAILYFLFVYPFLATTDNQTGVEYPFSSSHYFLKILFMLLVVIIYMIYTVMLAYPLTVKDLPGRILYKGFLLVILTASPIGLHELLTVMNWNMVYNVAGPSFSGVISIMGIFVIKSIFNSRYEHLKKEAAVSGRGELHSFFMLFIPKMWKPLIALGVLHFVTIWNAYLPSYFYSGSDHNLRNPAGMFYSLLTTFRESGITQDMILKFGLVISLPPIILFLIFRKWLTSEVFVGEMRK